MTSEVHHGHWKHELIGTMIDNVQDVIPRFGDWFMTKLVTKMVGDEFAKKKN